MLPSRAGGAAPPPEAAPLWARAGEDTAKTRAMAMSGVVDCGRRDWMRDTREIRIWRHHQEGMLRSGLGFMVRDRPGWIGAVVGHRSCQLCRVGTKILFVHDVVFVDDERHHARCSV